MLIAVLSDIHGNLEALRSVLEDMDRLGVSLAVSLGDNIGYGPEPQGVLDALENRGIPSVMGNHELGLVKREMLSWFNPLAKQALLITERLLSAESLNRLASLPYALSLYGGRWVHGCPPRDPLTYLFELGREEFLRVFEQMAEPICFVGHTHTLGVVTCHKGGLGRIPLGERPLALEEGWQYIINAGSVGQPRDGDPRAKYLIWDQDAGRLLPRFVPYDIAQTARLILEKGIPRIYADRLW